MSIELTSPGGLSYLVSIPTPPPYGPHFTPHIVTQKNFIANQWVAAATGETIPVLNPSDGKPFEAIARSGEADVDRAVVALSLIHI